ncbi:hypothetical protein MRX96_013213 [Rhipicephalus microplus]
MAQDILNGIYASANEGEESFCYASPEMCLEEECPEGPTGKPTDFTPSRKRSQVLFEIHKLLHEAEMECLEDSD